MKVPQLQPGQTNGSVPLPWNWDGLGKPIRQLDLALTYLGVTTTGLPSTHVAGNSSTYGLPAAAVVGPWRFRG